MDIKGLTRNVRQQCDDIDKLADRMKTSTIPETETRTMLEYSITNMQKLTNMIDSAMKRSKGGYKSYLVAVGAQLDLVLTEIDMWRTEGISPESISRVHQG